MYAEFEAAIHSAAEAGEAMSGAAMSKLYAASLERFYGPSTDILPNDGIGWAVVLHFFLNFYVFQYATSITASAAIAQRILDEGPKASEAYLSMLKAGGSDYPIQLIRRAGIDLASPEPYRAVIARFSKAIDELEALIA